jgi:hypothetical protein
VTITGTNFTGASAVNFGGAAASFTVTDSTHITAVSPAGSGVVDVTVTTVGGTSGTGAASDQFTYAGAPTVTSLTPNGGSPTGGTLVVIVGSNFTPTSTVKFGTVASSGAVTYVSSSEVKATSPAGTLGAVVDVTVTTIGGTSGTSSADLFTYATAPSWGTPPNVTALAGHLSAVVSWTAAASNGSTISAYTVTPTPVGPTASVSGTTTSFTVTGLSGGVSYTFTVTAINAFGSTASAPSNSVTVAGAGSTCLTASLSPNPPSPALHGGTIAVLASSTGCPSPIYEFWLRYPNNTVLLQQVWGPTATWTWYTGSYPVGTYEIRLGANQAGDSTASFEAKKFLSFTLVSGCADALVSAGVPSPQEAGAQVTFTASFAFPGSLCSSPEYQFWWQYPGGSWNIGRPFSTLTTWTWSTSGFLPGTYKIVLWVNQSGTSTAIYQSYAQMTMTLNGCYPVSISTSPAPPQHSGTAIQITGQASCSQPQYRFWMLAPGSSSWVRVQDYSATATYSWSATLQVIGTYNLMVWAIDANSGGAAGNSLGRWDSYTITKYTLTPSNICTSVTLTASPPSGTAKAGTPVTITASASGCSSAAFYQFWILAPGSSIWQDVQMYSSANSYHWSAVVPASGPYNFAVWVRDISSPGYFSSSLGRYDALASTLYWTSKPCTAVGISSSPASTATVGTPVTISGVSPVGCPTPLYQFWILRPGSSTWQLVQAYMSSANLSWSTIGLAKGVYHFSVWARDTSSTGTSGNSLGRWDAYNSLTYTLT